ncbi:MAG: hypothetical protein NUV52_00195 [Candidatus Roizmanbacteria bacterium]|nr:hypothetical protein [Candidatus Roizmanbacteria bacterium]
MLKFIYTVFVGVLIATFIGLGIDTLYPAPEFPMYSGMSYKQNVSEIERNKYEQEQEAYQKKNEQYQQDMKVYNRNVSMIALAAAVVTLAVGLLFSKNLLVIADGAMVGGIFTLLYSVIRGFQADDAQFRFVLVTVGLVIALVLGYLKFIRPDAKSR